MSITGALCSPMARSSTPVSPPLPHLLFARASVALECALRVEADLHALHQAMTVGHRSASSWAPGW
jgi:hypothetical protein